MSRYTVTHTTTYTYPRPVMLQPHQLRLRPRSDDRQSLRSFALKIEPEPIGQSPLLDLDGNGGVRCWFKDDPVEQLVVQASSAVETQSSNPFNYLLEPWATHLPLDYSTSLGHQLRPYLVDPLAYGNLVAPEIIQLAQELRSAAKGNVVVFLSDLNQRIYQTCRYLLRETGEPQPAVVTWTQQMGSCRDFAVLVIEVCRAVGLAARFVTGYHESDPGQATYLHAWAEVYLPGAGWRGYDPTQGLVVADRHIALVASPLPQNAATISGTFRPAGVAAGIQYTVSVVNEGP